MERLVCLDTIYQADNGSYCSQERNNQTNRYKEFQRIPFHRILLNLSLRDVHLHWEVNCQRPECCCSDKAQDRVEEGEYHCNKCCQNHICCPPHQSEEVDAPFSEEWYVYRMFFVDEIVFWPCFVAFVLNKLENWLCKHLPIFKNIINMFIFILRIM